VFSSLSRCKPSSTVVTSFVAEIDLTLDIDSSITIKVNNVARDERPILIRKNNNVSATLTSPSGWTANRKILYSINGNPLSFVVANENRSSINFTLEGLANRWYRYDVDDNHFVSYYNYKNTHVVKSLGFNDIPFAADIGQNIKDFSPNNFIVKSPAGLKKKRPQDVGSHYDEIVFENDYLVIDKSEEFSLLEGKFTIDLRVKPFSIEPTEKYLVGTFTKDVDDEVSGWALTLVGGKINFIVDSQLRLIAQNNLILNEWNHVAVTRDNDSTKLWINGVLSAESSESFSDTFEGAIKIATSEDLTLFPPIGNKKYNFIGALSCFRIIKGDSLYNSNFETPEPVLSLTSNTVLLTIQEDPGTIYLINVIPDPKTKTVYFYNQFGHLLDNIKLPSEPCQVEKFISEDGGYFIVGCRNKRLYKITLDKRIINKDYLLSNDGKILEWIFQLPYETDVAFVGSFSTFARIKNKQINIGQPNSISMSNGKTWVGGYNKIWQIDKHFKILQDFDVSGTIVGLTSLGDSAAVIIKSETSGNLDLTLFDSSGISASIHNSKWMSEPLIYNGHIYVTDSVRRCLIKVNPDTFTKEITDLGNNTPSYISANSKSIFIACHDNNKVLIYSGQDEEIKEVYFPEKVTWVSALEDSFMVSHYLKDKQVLAHDNPSIIYEPTKKITCNKSMASMIPFKIKNLGISSYTITPNDFVYWVDGVPNTTIKHGTYFSISKNLDRLGYYQENVIIGDTVIDFKAFVESGDFYPQNILFDPISDATQKDVIEISFQYKHNFIKKFNSAYRSASYASINYGYLKKNFSLYVGESQIFDGDIVTVCIPFGLSVPNSIVTLTIGKREFLIPVNSTATVTEVKSFLDVNRTSIINHEFIISKTGKYFVPYFTNMVNENLRTKDVSFKDYTIVNVGGDFSLGFPLINLNIENELFVPLENGLLDIYIDVNYPIVANRLDILINYDYDDVQIIDESNPVDEEGNTNFIKKRIFRKTPTNFSVKASNDGTNWILIKTFENISNSPNNWTRGKYKEFSFDNNTPYRYWRFQNLTTQELGVSVNGLVLKAKFPSFFSIKRNGNILSPGVVDLVENDNISVNISSNDRLYDAIRYFIVGPNNYELLIRSAPNTTLNYIIFNDINAPTLREEYISESIPISSTLSTSLNLYSFDPFLTLSKNGGEFSMTVQVKSNDTIRLKRLIRNVFDSYTCIYDMQEDEVTGEIVNVDVMKINIKNVVLTVSERPSANYVSVNTPAKEINTNNFIRVLSSHEKILNLFNPLNVSKDINFIENFTNNATTSEKFNSLPTSTSFNISTKFSKLSASVNYLLGNDTYDFDLTQINNINSERYKEEINSYNLWNIGSDFEFINNLNLILEANPFVIEETSINYLVIDRFLTEYIQHNFNLTFHLFRFEKALRTFVTSLANEYNRDLYTYLKILSYDYHNKLNNFLISLPLDYVNSSKNLLRSLAFKYANLMNTPVVNINEFTYNDVHIHHLVSQIFVSSPNIINSPIIQDMLNSVFVSSPNIINSPIIQGYSIIPPLHGNLLFTVVSYLEDANTIVELSKFPFINNVAKVLPQKAKYNFNEIKTYSFNYLQNVTFVKPNYLFVKINYETHDRFLYTFKENGFYGFFDSESDAENEARRKKHSPFKVYSIPQTNKWTYRREYQFIDGCSIGDGRIKRLVQGG
jgi:hypothetical protein